MTPPPSVTTAPFGGSDQDSYLAKCVLARVERPIAPTLIEETRRFHRQHGGRKAFSRTLVDQDMASDVEVAGWIAEHLGQRVLRASELHPKTDIRGVLPDALARSRLALPIDVDRKAMKVTIAIPDPEQPGLQQIRYHLASYQITWAIAPYGDLETMIESIYTPKVQSGNEIESMVEQMLSEAALRGASDIHINPDEHLTRIFFRIDGVITAWRQVPAAHRDLLTTQVKLCTARGEDGRTARADTSGGGILDVARNQVPQDARATRKWGGKKFSLRFSSLPTNFGESIVIRLLDQNAQVVSLADLGLLPDHHSILSETVSLPHGILAMVGPTGSGKSTTLAASLKMIDPIANRIISAEDPIEYRLRGVQQAQVNSMMSFEDILRTALRQDPDVMLIGEMRNRETAGIAVTAANTGHLILTTVHANTGILGITRLLNLGITADLMSSTIRVLFAQRLIRRLCPSCRRTHPKNKHFIETYAELLTMAAGAGFYSDARMEGPHFHEAGAGCTVCGNSGYKRRTVIAEARTIIPEVEPLIARATDKTGFDDSGAERIYAQLVKDGHLKHRTMREDGIIKASLGILAIEDVFAETIE